MGQRTWIGVSEPVEFLPYARQSIDDGDIAAVVEALRSDFLTTGPLVGKFERALANHCGAKYAVAVANGTAALHVAALAAGFKPGDRVLTSAITFVASANCAEFVGATADFADIDARTYNVTAETLAAAWRPDVAGVVAVDFAGQPCDIRAIAELVRSHGAIVIEDASHAIGGECRGQRVGGHAWADLTVFSFHAVKTITTGEGGAVVTDDENLAERCRLFRNHGIRKVETAGPWYYEMDEPGYNYRITDLQCALGLSQLKKLDRFAKRRQEIVEQYSAAFSSLPHITTPHVHAHVKPVWHLYVVQIDFDRVCKTRADMVKELRKRGVGTQVHYFPVHLQPYYRKRHGYGPGKCPVAEAYYERCLSLPLFPAMTDDDVRRVIDAVGESIGCH
jgi:perosamine synthetase